MRQQSQNIAGSAAPPLRVQFWRLCQDHPVRTTLVAAAIVRMIAVFTAKGFMASDDYFVYLHIPWIWSRGGIEWFDMDHPSGFSIVYPGINYIFILAMRAIGVEHPDHMMYVNRALHAAWSMIGVWYGVRIAQRATGDHRTVLAAGMFAALLFVLPYASVRNLPEMVCVPLVMAFCWHGQRVIDESSRRDALLSGLAIGAAFIIRYQSFAFALALFVMLAWRRQWKLLALATAGILIPLALQGIVDLISYGKFFGAPIQYFGYNLEHSSEYVVGPWYRYILLLIGIFIPPFSIVVLSSSVLVRKKVQVLFWSTLTFLILHSLTPAKQERFIIPALMPLAVLGGLGIGALRAHSFGKRWNRLLQYGTVWFWLINTVFLALFLSHYGKRGQIEALDYLYTRGNVQQVLVDRTDFDSWLPNFYLDIPRDNYFWISHEEDWASFKAYLRSGKPMPEYGLILVPHNINEHLQRIAAQGIHATLVEHFGPGPLEWILWRLNPKYNSTNDVWIVRLEYL